LEPATFTGRVAVVVTRSATLRRSYDATSQVLSRVPRGTNLALVYQAGPYYGVLMIDSSVGWVRRDSVEMIDYQVSITPAPGSELAEAEAQAAANTAAVPPSDGALPDPGTAPRGDLPTSAAAASSVIPSNVSPRAYSLLQEALTYLGVPYVWGGESRRGLDCSAFVRSVYASEGIGLPRVAADQAIVGQLVNWSDLRPGDRLYFDMGNHGHVSHTGMYLGNGYFIHASTNHGRVDVDSIFQPNYYRALVCARRSL
jgi:cell wall-associated NlpC family hydrolase